MRTNIEIDDKLMAQALKLTGLPTKRAVVEEGLRLMVRLRKQARALKSLKGLGWEGDLDEMRQDRPVAPVVILVDSSVWIAHLRGSLTPATAKLEAAADYASRYSLATSFCSKFFKARGTKRMRSASNAACAASMSCHFSTPIWLREPREIIAS